MNFIRCHYKGFLSLGTGILLAFFLSRNPIFNALLLRMGSFGYQGAFIAGLFFVSTLTIATAVLMLIALSHALPPVTLSIFAACGATLGNYLIFLVIKKHIIHPLRLLRKRSRGEKHHRQLNHFGHLLLPFLGALIIASPLPDELGILLLSIYKMKTYQFVFISFLLKMTGIYLLVSNLHYIM